ncbi:MAG: carbonic anhydrase family protein [Leptonema sp. (in: Bacteria)]|nr:carbonic anhydrase family protein [Leptonema sp. (in: bacteria)]
MSASQYKIPLIVGFLFLLISCSTSIVSSGSFKKVEWLKATECSPANIYETIIHKIEDPKFQFGVVSFRNLAFSNGPIYELSDGASFDYQNINYKVSTIRLTAPSNHQIGGLSFLFEIQFFAVSNDNQPIALSIFIRKGEENPSLKKLIQNNRGEIDLGKLLPTYGGHYTYQGALPKPDCYFVKWIIMKSAIDASADDLEEYLKRWSISPAQITTFKPIFETE